MDESPDSACSRDFSVVLKPKCVQGRHIFINADQKKHVLLINDFGMWRDVKKQDCLSAVPFIQSHTVDLPSHFGERIIGRPICIGVRENLFIIQYLTAQCKYVRFFFVDIKSNSCQQFEDKVHYFKKDVLFLGPVECMIDPGLTKVLFRLPQSAMSRSKWSKMLEADVTPNVESDSASRFLISDIHSGSIRDRKSQCVAFDPRFHSRVAYILLDIYCSKCKLMIYDLHSKKEVREVQHRFAQRPAGSDDWEQSDSSDEEMDQDYHFLTQCNTDYCRSGEMLALCCLVQGQDRDKGELKLYLFHADTLSLLASIVKSTSLLGVSVHWNRNQLFAPVFSVCDSNVSLWEFTKGLPPQPLDLKVTLPKMPQLQNLCRRIILKHCQIKDLEKLPLPFKLVSFLHFKLDLRF